ncbi:MAG: acetate kinase [Peptococcaceae bacterium]|nr:acetate kinase [Peptococcaceae bacterium]MBQ2995490.1 acetate kinase [Peptococcaceae bacterium]
MKVLVINSGSSSLKFQLRDMTEHTVMAQGTVEKIGLPMGIFTLKAGDLKITKEMHVPNHEIAVELALSDLLETEAVGLQSLDEIDAIGHRIVQGGDSFDKAMLITEDVYEKIREYGAMAPLHNPAHLKGIDACSFLVPGKPQIAVFDTAFHQTMEPAAYTYGLPKYYAQKHKIRRYGAHGTSHKYVAGRVAELMGKPLDELKIITCHLGNGSSITAIKNGKVVDTSMGFTPHEGMIMGTRCGDIDATAVLYLMRQEQISSAAMDHLLNKESGLLGVSGVSSDLRDIENAIKEGNADAKLARDIFVHRAKKYIGSYIAEMNGVDAIVFTAGIGENSADARRDICADLEYLGISIDEQENNIRGEEKAIHSAEARVQVWVVPTNEELSIAEDVVQVLQSM